MFAELPNGGAKPYRRGTHRASPPAATLQRLRRLLPAFGITRVANVTGLDCIGIPVVMVCRPNSRGLAVSQGKGYDLDAAKVSGLMESIESFHAERIDHPLRLASYHEMWAAYPLADIERIPRPEDSTFDGHLRLLWIEGVNLLDRGPRWVPFEAVHTDFRLPYPEGSGAFYQSSNGLASGNDLREALSHAICELVERDASTLWEASSARRQQARRVNLDTVDDPLCQEILARFRAAAVAVAVWETTSDVGLSSFDCLIVEQELNPIRPLPSAFGAGCHPAREVALLRALTEAAQSRLTSISGSRDDIDYASHDHAHAWETLRSLHRLITVPGTRGYQQAPHHETKTFDEDLDLEIGLLREAGFQEVIAVNLTRRGLDIPVVKVVIPGLETSHRMPGYVQGPRSAAAARARA